MDNAMKELILTGVIFLTVFAVAIVLIVLGINSRQRAGSRKKQYDERQKIAQGKAYTAAFYTLVAYIFINSFVMSNIYEWAKEPIAAFIGIALAITVFAVYATATDAYFGPKENVTGNLICMALLIVLNAVCAFALMTPMVVDGQLSVPAINIAAIVPLLAVFITMLVKKLARGRESEDE